MRALAGDLFGLAFAAAQTALDDEVSPLLIEVGIRGTHAGKDGGLRHVQ